MDFLQLLLIVLTIKGISTYSIPARKEYLDANSLGDVLDVLREHHYVGNNWRGLCLSLGLYANTLDIIEANHHDINRHLEECLKRWLAQADDVNQKGGPTWHSLITALKKINEIAAANGIDKEKHPACEILYRHTSDSSIQEPISNLATLLYKENVVKQEEFSLHRSSRRGGQLLLKQVKKAVCDNYQILEKFAAILQQSSSTIKTGNAIMNEYRKVFQTYEAPTMNEGRSIHLDTTVDLNFIEFEKEYAAAVFNINRAMENAVSLEDLMDYLNWGYKHPDLHRQLRHSKNKADVLKLISDYSSMININLLEAIVNEFNVEAAKPIIQKHKERIKIIQQSVLHQVLDQELFAGSPLQSEKIKIYVKHDVQSCTFDEVQQLIKAAFKENEPYVRIVVIKEASSYIVTCSFPLLLSEELISTALDNIETLKEKGVQRLTIGFSTVFDNNEAGEQEKSIMSQKIKKEAHHVGEYWQSVHTSRGMLEQMAVYMSVKLLNDEDNGINTETDTESTQVPWLSMFLLLTSVLLLPSIITIYVLTEQVRILNNPIKPTEDSKLVLNKIDDGGAEAAPHTWRHYKRGPKEMIIIGSFGNHEDWSIKQQVTVLSKLIPDGLEGSYDEWMKEEVEGIVKIYEKDPKNYEMKFIFSDFPGMEQSRDYYIKNIKNFFKNCEKDEALICYTGHSEKDTGNWCFKDGVVTFDDIFNLYAEHFKGKSLQIVSDCSYSGNWIKECAKKLDEHGILSCGHHTREQGILLKFFTSCQPNEEATLLTYCRRGIRYSEEDKGVVLKYDEEIKLEQAQKGQNPMYIDFRHIHCYKLPEDQCELDSMCTWEDRLGNKREQILPVLNEDHWCYVLVDKEKTDEFKAKNATENIEVGEAATYGEVLHSGSGRNPPVNVKRKLKLRFGVNTFDPLDYADSI